MTDIVIALGSNLGDRVQNLRDAVEQMEARGVATHKWSDIWETPPVPADQPEFLNAVITGVTDLRPLELLRTLKEIEYALGRRPGRRWGPRPIDLDILFFGDEAMDTPELTIPHPRIAERAFVLAPLSDVMDGPLPVLARSPQQLLEVTGLQGAVRTTETWARP